MGNSNSSTSSRFAGSPSQIRTSPAHLHANNDATAAQPSSSNARSARSRTPDLSFLGIGTSAGEATEVRRESKQEREARKLEKERVAREKERERSMREEHVDGGYLVTQGVYTGIEDFNKGVVRSLMVRSTGGSFACNHIRLAWG